MPAIARKSGTDSVSINHATCQGSTVTNAGSGDVLVNNVGVVREGDTVQSMFTLQPRLYVVQTYPLSMLTCFIYRLFNPFARVNYKVTSIYNNTDSVALTPASNLASLSVDKYITKFTDYYLVTGLAKEIEFKVTVFVTIGQSVVDISDYPFSDLESVNITGHIANYTYADNIVTLTDTFLYPLPIALNFSVVVNTSDITNTRNIYQVPTAIGYTPDYILYNNTYYIRSRNEIPIPQEFTYTSNGALLWI